jgi:RNA polymerase sigma factor for flagellar operon FliA
MKTSTARKYTTNDTELTRQQLITKYYPMVRQIATKMAKSYPDHVQVDDLVQIGVLGLIEAIDRFKPEKFPSFVSYAKIRIQGAILDDRRSQDWTPRSVRDRASLLQNAQTHLTNKFKRLPTKTEMAKYLNVSIDRLQNLYSKSEIRTVVSLDNGSEDNSCLEERIPSSIQNPQEFILRKEQIMTVQKNLKTLTEREQKVIQLYYYKGISLHQISKNFGVSEARISQIHGAIKSKMRIKLLPMRK